MEKIENQENYQTIISYFERILPLEEWEKDLICEIFEFKEYNWREFILKEGEICDKISFVVEGCLRLYSVDNKGNIHISTFATENWMVVDVKSFREKTPAKMNIDTLEKTKVLQASSEKLYNLYKEAPKFNYIIRELLEQNIIILQQRLMQSMYATAQERYEIFISMYPHLLQRISHTQIAYYLGITPEFLSKIRRTKLKS